MRRVTDRGAPTAGGGGVAIHVEARRGLRDRFFELAQLLALAFERWRAPRVSRAARRAGRALGRHRVGAAPDRSAGLGRLIEVTFASGAAGATLARLFRRPFLSGCALRAAGGGALRGASLSSAR